MRKKRIRIKVITRYEDRLRDIYARFYSEDGEYPEVDPIIENVPDGRYQIRGNEKGYSSEYVVLYGKWFLLSRSLNDYYCGITPFNIAEFNLTPSLSPGEWSHIEKTGLKRLSPLWRKYLLAHWIEMDHNNLKREIKRRMRQFDSEEDRDQP